MLVIWIYIFWRFIDFWGFQVCFVVFFCYIFLGFWVFIDFQVFGCIFLYIYIYTSFPVSFKALSPLQSLDPHDASFRPVIHMLFDTPFTLSQVFSKISNMESPFPNLVSADVVSIVFFCDTRFGSKGLYHAVCSVIWPTFCLESSLFFSYSCWFTYSPGHYGLPLLLNLNLFSCRMVWEVCCV